MLSPRPEGQGNKERRGTGPRCWSASMECVVCLEEYVDGVSKVMRLPCGHEFHAECMYVPRHLPFQSFFPADENTALHGLPPAAEPAQSAKAT